jgi:hypothetical protein
VKGLIIDEPWVSMIIAGKKTWEMRSRDTKIRGRIAIIRKGSKAVVGVADLVGTVLKLSRSDLRANVAKHQVRASGAGENSKYDTGWVLERARPLPQPVPYRHPAGAVIWVNLDPNVRTTIEQQLAQLGSQNPPAHHNEHGWRLSQPPNLDARDPTRRRGSLVLGTTPAMAILHESEEGR